MTVYAELQAKIPLKAQVKNRIKIPKRMSLVELNQLLETLEQCCRSMSVTIPLSLKIVEESVTGTATIFSNDWVMAAGKQTNILVLINYALTEYYPDTPQDQKDLLLSKIESGLNEPEVVSFEVSNQKKERKEAQQQQNILDLAVEPRGINAGIQKQTVQSLFQWKTAAPLILSYIGLAIVCVVLSVGTAMYMVTANTTVGQPTTALAQTETTTNSASVILPFTVHEKDKKEQLPITLHSYMKVDQLAVVKGTAVANKELVFKNKDGKTIGQTKTDAKGTFSIELIEGT
ncbi:hypothetical protein [Enterococcus plantarum]|nr:hypothetical protein [Enterococcus plantarum]MBO0422720.1 hypothetical protein [Enterococcus plantarum]